MKSRSRMEDARVQERGAIIVHVLGDIHWIREITSFMDGMPGLILSFQRQQHSSGKKKSHVVHEAVEAEDLRVLETIDRLVKQPQYATRFDFEAAALYACYRERSASFQWLEDHRYFHRQLKADRKCTDTMISHGSDELRVVHEFLVKNLEHDTATSSNFDPAPALTAAVREGRADLVALLLDFGWPNGYSVGNLLRLAAAGGHAKIVRLLVTKGKWRSLLDATMQASYYGHTDIVEYLKQAYHERNSVARL